MADGDACLNEFLIWFWRPIAETLGVIAFAVALIVLFMVFTSIITVAVIVTDKVRKAWNRLLGRPA